MHRRQVCQQWPQASIVRVSSARAAGRPAALKMALEAFAALMALEKGPVVVAPAISVKGALAHHPHALVALAEMRVVTASCISERGALTHQQATVPMKGFLFSAKLA